MAIVSRGGGPSEAGGGATRDGGGDGVVMTNLPPRTGPVCGRRPEMQAIADAYTARQRAQSPGFVEITGAAGTGASTVAVELARRVGVRFPGGAWYLRADLGPDLAWADLAAARGETATRSLAESAARERERVAAGPRALLVVDGVASAEAWEAVKPPQATVENGIDGFVVADARTGAFEHVVDVPAVPEHAARRIAHAVLRLKEGDAAEAPVVRSCDGLAITASLAARVAVARHPDPTGCSVPDLRAALMQLLPLVSRGPGNTAVELMLLAGVAHPTLITTDALHGALAQLRGARGIALADEDVGHGVLHLVRLGLLTLDEESRVSIHPLVQEAVRGIVRGEEDLRVAQRGLAAGLVAAAEQALGDDGVDVRLVGLHQLRHLHATAEPVVQEQLAPTIAKVEAALGIAS